MSLCDRLSQALAERLEEGGLRPAQAAFPPLGLEAPWTAFRLNLRGHEVSGEISIWAHSQAQRAEQERALDALLPQEGVILLLGEGRAALWPGERRETGTAELCGLTVQIEGFAY